MSSAMETTFLAGPGAPRVLAVSARDERAAADAAVRLADRLAGDPSLDPDDVALTLVHGRERFAVRHAVTGTTGAELADALREAAERPHREAPVPVLVLDLGDGSALPGTPALPQVAEASAAAGESDPAAGAAVRTAAELYGTASWLTAHGVRPDAVVGRGPAAAAAAAVRGALSLPDALRAAATGADVPSAAVAADPEAEVLVVRVGDGAGVLGLDPLDPASYARLFAALWERGFDVDCTLGRGGRRVRLPGYPFRRSGSVTAVTPAPGLRPLTPYEQRWLFHDLVRSGSAAEHALCATAVLPGPVPGSSTADAALAALLDRRPNLRTVFTRDGGRWFARDSQRPVAAHVLDPAPGTGPEALVRAAAVEETFAAADVPLVRCVLAPAGGNWAVALSVYAPVAGDSSADELLAEWAALAGTPLRPATTGAVAAAAATPA
ncbi:CurL C-terminal domain-containing protein [Streptomyces sp. NPDC001732]